MIQNRDTKLLADSSLSSFWREHRSDKIEEELANVLDAASGYVGFFGSDFSVAWGKESQMVADIHKVILDYAPLYGKTPPYDGIDIDKVMGTVIHECGHIKWSYPEEKVQKLVDRLWGGYRGHSHQMQNYNHGQVSKEIMHIANTIEDFYVENKISERYPTLGAYLRETRKYIASTEAIPQKVIDDLATDEPAFDSLLAMWGSICLLDDQIPANASAITKDILNELIKYTMKATKATDKKRLTITREIWEKLEKFKRAYQKEQERQEKMRQEQESESDKGQQGEKSEPSEDESEQPPSEETTSEEEQETEPQEEEQEAGEEESEEGEQKPEDRQPPEKQTEGEQEEETEESQGESEEEGEISEETTEDEPYPSLDELSEAYSMPEDKTYLPTDLKQAVDEYQEKQPVDITKEVMDIVGGTAGDEIRLELAHSNPALANKYRAETYKTALKLSRIFQFDKRLRTRYSRGLLEGAVDSRRLARAGAENYKLFERKEVLSMPNLAVTVLVDMSGSMERRVSQVMQIATALKTALDTIPDIGLSVMAYKGGRYGAFTQLLRIYDRASGGFRADLEAVGGTPSGYAIAGTASQMLKTLHGKDKLLVHITDGCPDTYEKVSKAVEYCNQNKIDVMTLTTLSLPKEAEEAYHGLVEQIYDFNDLPDRISKLLRKRLQKQLLKIR